MANHVNDQYRALKSDRCGLGYISHDYSKDSYVLHGLETYSHNHMRVQKTILLCHYMENSCIQPAQLKALIQDAGYIALFLPLITSKSSTQLNVKYNSKGHTY